MHQLVLHLCIWPTLLSKVTYVAFQGTYLHSNQFLGIKPITLALQAPTLYCLSSRHIPIRQAVMT